MKRIYMYGLRGKKFAEDDGNITILTDEDDIKAFLEEVRENLENAEEIVEF